MASDYEAITRENIRLHGEDTFLLEVVSGFYTDKTHFVFELLQNAEDAGATSICFSLSGSALEVEHDGRLFTPKDVEGLCGVGKGTKADDITKIGKFGLGFKSVFAFTSSPEIHSGVEHFRIEKFVRPCAVSPVDSLGEKTRFILPFTSAKTPPEQCLRLIADRIERLDAPSLLFLKSLKEVCWSTPSASGVLVRDDTIFGFARRVRLLGERVVGGQTESQEQDWLVFDRPVPSPPGSPELRVEVAFRSSLSDSPVLVPVSTARSKLVVFFPTEKETHLGFLVQGPYRTTYNRENIPPDDEWNQGLIKETAALVVDSVRRLAEMGLLTVKALEALPIRSAVFPAGSMFWPIYEAVRDAFKTSALLPTDRASYCSGSEAKIAVSAELRELFPADRLADLLGESGGVSWLTGDITPRLTPDLYAYLTGAVEVNEISTDAFAARITKVFLEEQSDEWVARFYEFLNGVPSLWSPKGTMSRAGVLRVKAIARLEDGTHVVPFGSNDKPVVYLPPPGDSDYPIIRRRVFEDPGALRFLKSLGLTEPDAVTVVVDKVLRRYNQSPTYQPSDNEYAEDLQRILYALNVAGERRNELMSELRSSPFVKAVNASSQALSYRKADEVYFLDPGLSLYFEGNEAAWFVQGNPAPEHEALLRRLGAQDTVRVDARRPDSSGYVEIENWHSRHLRGIDGFDPHFRVDELRGPSTTSPSKNHDLFGIISLPDTTLRYMAHGSSRHARASRTARGKKPFPPLESSCSGNDGCRELEPTSSSVPGNWHAEISRTTSTGLNPLSARCVFERTQKGIWPPSSASCPRISTSCDGSWPSRRSTPAFVACFRVSAWSQSFLNTRSKIRPSVREWFENARRPQFGSSTHLRGRVSGSPAEPSTPPHFFARITPTTRT